MLLEAALAARAESGGGASLAGVRVAVVDADLLGCEVDIAILSCVRAGAAGAAAAAGAGGGLGALSDGHRICVALSRAREGLVVVGSARCLNAERQWRNVLQSTRVFGAYDKYEQAVREEVAAGWAAPLRAHEAEAAARAERADADARAVEGLRQRSLDAARRRARAAAGIEEKKELLGWSTDAPAANGSAEAEAAAAVGALAVGDDGAAAGAAAEVVPLHEAVVAAVSAGVGEGTLAAVTALAEARDLGPLDCLRPTLEALLAGAADGAAPKKARLAASKAALGGAAALIGGLGSGAVAQVALLAALQACCEVSPPLAEVFEHVLLQLYELDGELLPEEAIFAWADGAARAPAGSALRRLHDQAKPVLDWLKEADEESDED